jgi:mercuric ion transport protein
MTLHAHHTPDVDSTPPTRSKVTGALAALACAACCAIPLLIAAGILTGTGAALLQNTLIAVAAGLFVAALGMWWLHRRRSARRAAAAGASCGCGGPECGG